MGERGSARAFVALPLGAELGELVAARCEPALEGAPFRATRGEGLHLTLFFLGDVGRAELPALTAALRAALAGLAAPVLDLGGTGAFPSAGNARVLWVGVEERGGHGRLDACRRAVLDGLARAGVDTRSEEDRAFHPHVTVARARGHARLPAAFGALSLGLDWSPRAVELLESRLEPGGSRYTCLERFALSSAE
jgi:2'-5' RNA ligase